MEGKIISIIKGITPRFCIFYNQQLYVTDTKAHEVIVYDEKWNIIRRFGESSMKWPRGITIMTIDNSFIVFVTDYELNINVFLIPIIANNMDSKGNGNEWWFVEREVMLFSLLLIIFIINESRIWIKLLNSSVK